MLRPFTYQVSPMRVVFGIGTLKSLPDELERLAISRALLLATPRQQSQLGDLAHLTGGRSVGVFGGAVVHTPIAVTERAMELPHTVAYNAPAATDAMARVSRALGTADAAEGLYELCGRLNAPRSLSEIGMPEGGIEQAAALAVKNPYWNPRPVEQEAIRRLLTRAWSGLPPAP